VGGSVRRPHGNGVSDALALVKECGAPHVQIQVRAARFAAVDITHFSSAAYCGPEPIAA
jgi:hypothetical protein